MSEDKLSSIQELLEDIKGLLLLSNQDKIEQMKKDAIKPGSIEETVYKLCDGSHTTLEIAKIIEKDNKYTLTVLGTLRRKGLIKTIEKSDKKVHEQRF
ncbi:MAG: hypothetical protein WD717_06520 [Nitrosarchaeum sp.]